MNKKEATNENHIVQNYDNDLTVLTKDTLENNKPNTLKAVTVYKPGPTECNRILNMSNQDIKNV